MKVWLFAGFTATPVGSLENAVVVHVLSSVPAGVVPKTLAPW